MRMWWIIPAGITGLLAIIFGKKTKFMHPKKTKPIYETSDWAYLIYPMADAAKIEPLFCLAWIKVESGGNPCAWGSATAKGPDGHPREQGIVQLYNPDDFKKFQVASGALRKYCTPGTQVCSRMLTDAEMQVQAKAAMDLILHCREVAGMAAAKNGLRWRPKDQLKLVKLVHGLPGLVKSGVALATKHLGRAPRDWLEFKTAVNATKMDAGTEKYRNLFPKVFANAEKVTAGLPDDTHVVT